MKPYIHRLLPNQDVKQSIIEFCHRKEISSAVLMMGIGSVSNYQLRVSDGVSVIESNDCWEIVSLSGTIANGKAHLHISLSGLDGRVVGGHLLEGTFVKTTVELYIHSFDSIDLRREYDETTGYNELVIQQK